MIASEAIKKKNGLHIGLFGE